MDIIDSLLQEFLYEASLTRVMLERVPEEHMAWKPHEKSMTLGRLAGHLAEIPIWAQNIMDSPEFVIGKSEFERLTTESTAQLLETFDKNVELARNSMHDQPDEHLLASWQLRTEDSVVFDMPRAAVIRGMVLNHMIHHRGQLSVYFRLKDVPLPALYGPSADEETLTLPDEPAG